ncbi:hypothetical protein B566_EDAN001282 [Ephemera danica]|nr:hypothetical protein B566_EDAN001282 [Ephemera danica]
MSITVIDGGFGTLLCRILGPSASIDTDPLWSARSLAKHPDQVVQAHMEFAKAGAQLIRTNSYQASIGGFREHLGLNEEESINLIKKSVELARQAITTFITFQLEQDEFMPPPLLVGSVGPYGAALHDGSEYTGSYASGMSEEQLMAWHRPRIRALNEAGIRLLAVETIPALVEARAVLRLLKSEFPHLRAWTQLEAVGVNCVHPSWVTPLLQSVKNANAAIPLIAYPNSGETWLPDIGWKRGENMKTVASYVPEWLKLGVRYVGGCCRTYPEDTSQILEEVKKRTITQ